MGVDTVTVQNLEIIEVNTDENYILVSGNVPGAKKSFVLIRSAVKGGKNTPKEIISYETKVEVSEEAPEEVKEVVEAVEEVKEETTEEAAPAEAEEAKEESAEEKAEA